MPHLASSSAPRLRETSSTSTEKMGSIEYRQGTEEASRTEEDNMETWKGRPNDRLQCRKTGIDFKKSHICLITVELKQTDSNVIGRPCTIRVRYKLTIMCTKHHLRFTCMREEALTYANACGAEASTRHRRCRRRRGCSLP
jgi:hypothetical protein